MYERMYSLETQHWWFRGKRDIVFSLAQPFLNVQPRPKLIDFGCGCGAMLNELTSYGEVLGVDYSDVSLMFCRKRFSGDTKKLDLSIPVEPWEQFDFGVALDILEHIENDDVAAQNICALLRDGGHCIVTVPAYQWLWTAHDENCMHKRRYSKRQLMELLQKANLVVDYISYYNCVLFPVAVVVRLFSRLFRVDKDSSIENHFRDSWLNQTLYLVFTAEKKRISARRHFPFGLSLIALAHKPYKDD